VSTINAIAPWFGSKRNLAPTIIAELGEHSAYWEPFCGSMAVVLVKPRSQQETVNDLHGDLVTLAMVVASDRAVDLYARLSRILFAHEILNAFRDELDQAAVTPPSSPSDVTDEHVARAVAYFVVSWMGRNGSAGCPMTTTAQFSVRWSPNGGHSPQRFAAAVESIPEWHSRLRNVCILHRDAFDVLERIDDHRRVSI
jgi:DNA adenine methylase